MLWEVIILAYFVEYGNYNSIFAVPSIVVEKYMLACSGTALKVLMVALHSGSSDNIEPGRIAGFLGMPTAEVRQALEFWANQGLLRVRPDPIEAVSQGQLTNRPDVIVQKPILPRQSHQTQLQKVQEIAAHKNSSLREIEALSRTDPNVREIAETAQSMLGRTLSRTETENLVSFYSYAGLSPQYIYLIMDYCFNTLQKKSINYVSRTISNFVAEDIDTYEKAEAHVENLTKAVTHEGQVRTAFGVHDRVLTAQEKKYINTWFDTYNFDIALIRLAYERTINNIGKLSFQYINTILTAWYNKGIKTPRQAAEESFSKTGNAMPPSGVKPAPSAGMASSIDMEELQYLITHGQQHLTDD